MLGFGDQVGVNRRVISGGLSPTSRENSADISKTGPGEPAIARRGGAEATTTDIEGTLAEGLADPPSSERVTAEGHFFHDLGADSMVMAQFRTRVRWRGEHAFRAHEGHLPEPPILSLARALAEATPPSCRFRAPAVTYIAQTAPKGPRSRTGTLTHGCAERFSC
ncbi:hypothetical protein [Streptomyces sp. NPDC096153]|uniref:acyl carrier protein n=1 Tax=Streptomyces sp. NPDC096153 TaxID=3155548 RepID=UPI003322E7CB